LSQTGAVSNQIRAVDWRHIALGAAALILAAIAYRTLFETSGSKPRKLTLNLDQLMQAGQGNLANFFAFSFSLRAPSSSISRF
jgi:hypothetical protein